MSITLTTNTGAVTTNTGTTASRTIWSSLEASTSQLAQTTNALVSGQAGGSTSLNGSLTPVIASAQATLDSIVSNPALNLSRVLTSPSFAALVSALEGNAGTSNGLGSNGLGGNGLSEGVSALNGSSNGTGNTSSSVLSIGNAAGNSSGAAAENAAATGNEGFFSKLLSELESVLQTPTGGNAADGLLSGAGLNTASQTGTQLAVA